MGISGERIELPDLKKPDSIQIDKNQIFITEGPGIFIYSKNTFKILNKFGKSGEGPREFKGGINLHINEELYINSLGKISVFDRKGIFQYEKKLETLFLELIPIGDRYFGISNLDENRKRYILSGIYNKDLKLSKEISKDEFFFQPGPKSKMDVISIIGPDGGSGGGVVVYKKQIFRQENSKICIYNIEGKKIQTIEGIIKTVKLTKSDKERYLNSFKSHSKTRAVYHNLKARLSFPENFPFIQNMIVSDDKLYVRTYKRENNKSEVYIIDLNGSLIGRVFVPIVENNLLDKFPYTIKNNYVYQLVDEEEFWTLKKFKIQ